jgi:hypothetical protein
MGHESLYVNLTLFEWSSQAPAPPEGHMNNLLPLYTQNVGPQPGRRAYRHLPQAPERILDAPDLLDDYYLNLLDWSSQNTVIPFPNKTEKCLDFTILLCKDKATE